MYIHLYLRTLHDFGCAQYFSNKFNVRNKFQKVKKWNCQDLYYNLYFGQARNMAAQLTECVRVMEHSV